MAPEEVCNGIEGPKCEGTATTCCPPPQDRVVEIGPQEFTKVLSTDEVEFGANHRYIVLSSADKPAESKSVPWFALVKFQKGPVKEVGQNGCFNEDLIAIVIDRLQSFQLGPFNCRENAIAITKLEEALMWLRKRTDDRKKRGVQGTYNK